MRAQIKWIFFFSLLIYHSGIATAQQKATNAQMTAAEIVQKAINNAGGDAKLEAIKSAEFVSQLITANNDTLSISVKRKGYNKCYISVMSFGYENTTTIFNNGNAVLIRNDTAERITDPAKLEALALQCYSSIDYGYKKLGYKLSRIEDMQASNFDCYGVLAESPLGLRTANYYDRKTGNCIMIMYPSGGRTIFTSFLPYRELLYNREELLADAKGSVTRSSLREINIDENPDDNWFHLPPAGDCKPPAIVKTGHSRYVNGKDTLANITRTENKQIENVKGSSTEYKIDWLSASDYVLYRLKNASSPPTNNNIEYIKTRITLWSGNRYYCQYITSTDEVGTCAFERVE